MSKRRHRDRGRNINGQNFNQNYHGNNMRGAMNNPFMNNQFGNNPFGINPQQLLSMLGGNFDMNRVNSILSSMNKEGFDINSVNDQMKYKNDNFSEGEMSEKTKNVYNDNEEIINKAKSKKIDEENMVFLINLKEIVDIKKQEFIDTIIQTLLK